MFLNRNRIIGPALDRRIVGDHHRLPAIDEPDPRDEAGAMHVALVHAKGGERADFEKRRTRINQAGHPFARQKLAAPDMALARPGGAALGRRSSPGVEFVEEAAPEGDAGRVLVRGLAQLALEPRHLPLTPEFFWMFFPLRLFTTVNMHCSHMELNTFQIG